MWFTILLIAIAFIVAIVYNSNKSNKQFKSISSTSPRRATIDNIKPTKSAKTNPNKTVFYGRLKKQIINCEPKKENSLCDMVLNIDFNTQTVSQMEIGNMRKFKLNNEYSQNLLNRKSDFSVLKDINTNETHYLVLTYNNDYLYAVKLTDSKDCGYIYFDKIILNKGWLK